MYSRQDLSNHLEEISESATFTKFFYVSSEKFSVQLKCKVDPDRSDYNDYVSEWIRKFSKFSATNWIVRTSFPNRKRTVYRKLYVCHRSSFNKTSKQSTETLNQGCRAKIDFLIKFINKNTIKNDPLLKQGLNMNISIEFVHSHKLRTPKAFKMLKSTSETDEIFCSYLTSGYTPTAAKLYHELTLIDRYGDDPEYLMNAKINPTPRHVHYLHKKYQKTIVEKQAFKVIMAGKKVNLESAGGYIDYDNPQAILIVTAMMRRVISSFSLDHVLIDSSHVNGSVVTFLYIPSKAGALPIVCVIHAEQDETNYTHAFLSVKAMLNTLTVFEPKLLTVMECTQVRAAADDVFPESTILTSKWSLCSKFWQLIHEDDNMIDSESKHNVMVLFSKMIRANSLGNIKLFYTQLKNDETVNGSKAVKYVDELWNKRGQWLGTNQQNCTNLTEASIRLMDEFIHRKCKSFNLYVMVDVVARIIENQVRHILQAHVSSADIAAALTRLLVSKDMLENNSDLKKVSHNEFRLENQAEPKSYITFRIDTWCCDCGGGKKGHFCEHLCSIISTVGNELLNPFKLNNEEKRMFAGITGEEFEETKMIKSENNDTKMNLDDSGDIETDDVLMNDDMEKRSETSSTLETNHYVETQSVASSPANDDDNVYYLDVKQENSGCTDPLEEPFLYNTEQYEFETTVSTTDSIGINVPSTSIERKNTSKLDLKEKYESAMKCLNNEFRRLNKYFKQNPNKGNMETMLRLARELSKIRPIERVLIENMHITLNRTDSETDKL